MKKNHGFTLAEVLIVAGIIALLAAIAIPNILRVRVNANETHAQTTLKTIAVAFENYYILNNQYPAATSDFFTATPPYLGTDYFNGSTYFGFTYTPTLTTAGYTVDAVPVGSNQGTASFTLSTGGIIQRN